MERIRSMCVCFSRFSGMYSRNTIATHKTWNDRKTSADNNYLGTKIARRPMLTIVCGESGWLCDAKAITTKKSSCQLNFSSYFFFLFTIANGRRYFTQNTHKLAPRFKNKNTTKHMHTFIYIEQRNRLACECTKL